MKADQTLDCVGLYCPMPIVRTAQKIKELKVGEVLEVVADDKGIKKDMPAWCETTGHEYVGMEEKIEKIKGGNEITTITVYVRKKHD